MDEVKEGKELSVVLWFYLLKSSAEAANERIEREKNGRNVLRMLSCADKQNGKR